MRLPSRPTRSDRDALKLRAYDRVRRAGRRVGLDIVRSSYYSPFVNPAELPADLWERAAPLYGLELDLDAQLRLIEERLLPLSAEFQPPLYPGENPWEVHLENPWYSPMDSHLLYAMVRHHMPRRVLELGSGFSTLIIQRALAVNADHGAVAQHDVVDPFPSGAIEHANGRVRLRAESAAAVPIELFSALQSGDVLFVDTSHAVRPGGEVVRLILEVLPTLAPGVIVHFHDIFTPYEYPVIFYEVFNHHWQEQYLLQAFLAYNPNFSVLCSNHALWRSRPGQMKEWFPGLRDGMGPSAFWFRRVESRGT